MFHPALIRTLIDVTARLSRERTAIRLLYELLIEDYPESELVEDSLFMLGDLAFEGLQDIRLAEKYFRRLLTEFPDSEYADDARYILDNLHNPRLRTPTSSEELQR